MAISKAKPTPEAQALGTGPTPVCHFDLRRLSNRVGTLREAANRAGVQLAYSIKTNPSPEVLGRVHAGGLLAEAINYAEVDLALEAGWQLDEVVLNGPAKTWGGSSGPTDYSGFHSSMCDCVDELTEWFSMPPSSARLGMRLRAADTESRFGLDLSEADERAAVAQAVTRANAQSVPLALHFHTNSLWNSLEQWLARLRQTFGMAGEIQGLSESITCIDLGGGWSEAGLDTLLLEGELTPVLRDLEKRFPRVEEFVLEPGESLVTGCGEVVARVMRAPRLRDERLEIVADASVAELPFRLGPMRPVFHETPDGEWRRISGGGGGVIHGRSCMTSDLLARDVDLSAVRKGDLLVFGGAGSYDVSLRTRFGSANCDARVVFSA